MLFLSCSILSLFSAEKLPQSQWNNENAPPSDEMVQTYRRGKMFLWHLRNARLPRRSIYSSRRRASPRRHNNNRAEERKTSGALSHTQSQMNADVCIASRRHSSSNVAFNARFARAAAADAAAGGRALLKRRGRQKRERHLLSSRQGGA